MALEVVSQLARGHQECEQELLWHGVACPCVPQYGADEVHRVLDEGWYTVEPRVLQRLEHILRWWVSRDLTVLRSFCHVALLSLVFCR